MCANCIRTNLVQSYDKYFILQRKQGVNKSKKWSLCPILRLFVKCTLQKIGVSACGMRIFLYFCMRRTIFSRYAKNAFSCT